MSYVSAMRFSFVWYVGAMIHMRGVPLVFSGSHGQLALPLWYPAKEGSTGTGLAESGVQWAVYRLALSHKRLVLRRAVSSTGSANPVLEAHAIQLQACVVL